MGAAENIAVVDLSGMLVAFLRMDNAFLGGIDLATKKAKSIVLFNGYNTTALYEASLPDGGLFGVFLISIFCVPSSFCRHITATSRGAVSKHSGSNF